MTDDNQKKIFSKNLNKYLRKYGKTQIQVSKDLGINPQTVNSWCRGIALPRMGKVQMLADYFRISKADLLEDEPTQAAEALDGYEEKLLDIYRAVSVDGKLEIMSKANEVERRETLAGDNGGDQAGAHRAG